MANPPKSKSRGAITGIGRPGGAGGNKVAKQKGSGGATGKARPGGPGGNKTTSAGGKEMKPRPGGAQPAG